jgi:hypothetical protein
VWFEFESNSNSNFSEIKDGLKFQWNVTKTSSFLRTLEALDCCHQHFQFQGG